jgi:hypothetical protein
MTKIKFMHSVDPYVQLAGSLFLKPKGDCFAEGAPGTVHRDL